MKQKFQQSTLLIVLFEVNESSEFQLLKCSFIVLLITDCEKFLKELDLKLVWPATKVFQAVARANSTCASLIWSNILPLLTKQFECLEQVNNIFVFTD